MIIASIILLIVLIALLLWWGGKKSEDGLNLGPPRDPLVKSITSRRW